MAGAMNSSLDRRQMSRAHAALRMIFFASLAALLGGAMAVMVAIPTVAMACWWLALLPLGRDYRWCMGSAALAVAGAGVTGPLFLFELDSGGASVPGAVGAFLCLVGPLVFCQAMVLFTERAGLRASQGPWHRARLVVFWAYGCLVVLVPLLGGFPALMKQDSAVTPSPGDVFRLFLFAAVSVPCFLSLLALFETQKEMGRARRVIPRTTTSPRVKPL